MTDGAFSTFAHQIASLRRVGRSHLGRNTVLAAGLCAMTLLTVPDLQPPEGVALTVCLWCCLAYFAVEGAGKARIAFAAGRGPAYLVSLTAIVDMVAILAVPIALLCGVAPPMAWLWASLWILKLAQDSPGFAQLGRVFVTEARPLASVLVLFLIVLVLSSAAMYLIERGAQPAKFGTLPHALWWAVVTLTTTGYGDEVPQTPLGHLLGSFVMVCGIGTFGLLTGILATGFAAESRRRNFLQTWDLVSKVPFFQSLNPAAIAEITHLLRRLEVPEKTTIIRRGRDGDCMYFIADGEVFVDLIPQPAHLSAGAFFGELALLGESVRTANVTTTRPSTLLVLDLADFRTFTATHPELARVIDAEGKRRMNENQRLRELQLQSGVSPS